MCKMKIKARYTGLSSNIVDFKNDLISFNLEKLKFLKKDEIFDEKDEIFATQTWRLKLDFCKSFWTRSIFLNTLFHKNK